MAEELGSNVMQLHECALRSPQGRKGKEPSEQGKLMRLFFVAAFLPAGFPEMRLHLSYPGNPLKATARNPVQLQLLDPCCNVGPFNGRRIFRAVQGSGFRVQNPKP